MPKEALGFSEDSASDSTIAPTSSNVQQTLVPATGAPTLLSLPRELRDMIYSHLFKAEYKQSTRSSRDRMKPHDLTHTRAETKMSDRLAILQTSRQLWEEGARILYGEHVFRFYVISAACDDTLLTQRTVDLMQEVEIFLGPSKTPASVRILHLFATSQTPRKSCIIKIQYRSAEFMNENVIEALKQLTGFNVLMIEIVAPVVKHSRLSGAPVPWVSGLLAYVQVKLTLALGPSSYTNGEGYRRLVFKPQAYKI